MPFQQPSFFIIGERKCATSAVYRYLLDHPQILPCRIKEPQFFSKPWWHRTAFASRYRALFPKADAIEMKIAWLDLGAGGQISSQELIIRREADKPFITGEASANTFAQVPPERLHRAYPEAKLILCLRHPVDRAYSHYRMLERFAQEGRRLPIQLKTFQEDFAEDLARTKSKGQGYFAGISFYTGNLRKWLNVFGKRQVHIVRTEDLQTPETAHHALAGICRFLEIPDFDFTDVLSMRINKAEAESLDLQTRTRLYAYYSDDVKALEMLTGRKFDWNP